MKIFRFILILICISGTTSCVVDEQCRQNKNVELGISFYHVTKNQSTGILSKISMTIDSITVIGLSYDSLKKKYVPVDSILYNKSRSISKIYLPLHKFINITKFEVKFNSTIDTVTIFHKNSDEYLSLECGCMKIHSIDSVSITNNFNIDSVRIINNNVKTNNAENLRIYK